MKKILLTIIALVVLLGGVFFYLTRPISAPSENSTETDEQTNPASPNTSATDGKGSTYVIDASQSEAKFEIDEILNGNPFHVVGRTKDVSGKIDFHAEKPTESTVGAITINARTLKTDSERRDGAIGRMILKSETNEFITFTPTQITGLPSTIQDDIEQSFLMVGNLSIAGVVREVTFDVRGTISGDTISGKATSKILYKDFDLTIPKVPMVARVEDEVFLTFTFVAQKA